jgi:predicted transcriptional regulator
MYDHKASDIMTKDVICVNPDMKINELDKVFIKQKINGAPVVDENGSLVGVVSKSDIVNYDFKKGMHASSISDYYRSTGIESQMTEDPIEIDASSMANAEVKDIMITNVITGNSDDSVHGLANTMCNKKIHRLIIVEENKVVGIVGTLDLLKVFGKIEAEKNEAKQKLDIALNAIEDLRKKL